MSEPRFDLCSLPDFRHTRNHHQADYIREELHRVFPGRQLCAAALKPRLASHHRVLTCKPQLSPVSRHLSAASPLAVGLRLRGPVTVPGWRAQPMACHGSLPGHHRVRLHRFPYIWVTASTIVSQLESNASTF
ncbi:hypothetical protein CSHISOI_03077 [Colletotrichum shisoi]|uniref:Uncharacterized protein n=1 Tax=Colletotrichum shisoi TaxID=2078593 RepID=A0A5Q4C1G6_9PEZI|nr:hypothetical protein CSHISOI_03077 [Colletotrichum shisoi]